MNRAMRMLALTGTAAAVLAAIPATAGAAFVSPTNLDFGSVPVGTTSPPQIVTLTADCSNILPGVPSTCLSLTADTVNVDVATTGEFSATSTCPAGLGPDLIGAASQSCPISVTFSPSGAGGESGALNTGTMGTPALVPAPSAQLAGTGLAPAGTTSPGTRPRARCRRHHKKNHHNVLGAKKRKCKKKRK